MAAKQKEEAGKTKKRQQGEDNNLATGSNIIVATSTSMNSETRAEKNALKGINKNVAAGEDNNELTSLPYEALLAVLEETVTKLESGTLPLEDSLSAFEKGINLIKVLTGKLDAMEQRMVILTEGGETIDETV